MSDDKQKLKHNDRLLLQRVSQGPVAFTHAIDVSGRYTKLVRSSISYSQNKHLHRLALEGYLCQKVTGCGGHGEPPETVVTYTLTALGREALDIHAPRKPTVNRWTAPTEEEMLKEGIE
jgi:hypothetical protein